MRVKSQELRVRSQIIGVKKFFIFFLLLLTLHSSLFTLVYAATVDDIVKDLQKKFSEIKDLKGTFNQTSYLKDLEKTEIYSGTFFMKKPDRIMWSYKAPRDEKIFITGNDTWIYKKSRNQALKSKFSKEAYSQIPIALLNSFDNLAADFEIALIDEDKLSLKPRKSSGAVREIIVRTAQRKFPIKMLKVSDIYGNVITIELLDVENNPGLDNALFVFTPPEGAEVFDMSQ